MTFIFFLLTFAYSIITYLLLYEISILLALGIAFIVFLVGFWLNLGLFALGLHIYGSSFKKVNYQNMFHHRVLNAFLKGAIHLLRLKVTVTGVKNLESEKPFIFVANHQSNYDTIVHKVYLPSPLVFIAKDAIFKWPVIGPMARVLGNIPIQRDNDREAIKALIKGIEIYEKEHISIGIYPEGTRSKMNSMIEFKSGSLKLAMKPKAKIVVGAIYNTIYTWKNWPFKKQRIYLHYFDPIEPSFYENMTSKELSDHIKAMIQEKLDEFEKR
jgi:1-acyl-sn-glycerol-3-phosphate acyltransferase